MKEKNKTCFVISPIGEEGSEVYKKFKDVLENLIKPAVEKTGLKIRVIRADDINKSGAWLEDIIDNSINAYLVIADLSEQSINVGLELGIRFSFSPRTILIAESLDCIPSDLRGYRTIAYGTPANRAAFQDKLNQYLTEIKNNPDRIDNPVLSYLSKNPLAKRFQLVNPLEVTLPNPGNVHINCDEGSPKTFGFLANFKNNSDSPISISNISIDIEPSAEHGIDEKYSFSKLDYYEDRTAQFNGMTGYPKYNPDNHGPLEIPPNKSLSRFIQLKGAGNLRRPADEKLRGKEGYFYTLKVFNVKGEEILSESIKKQTVLY